MSPKRIQRKRSKGWRMPEGAVYVGRPSKWGNDYIAGQRCYVHRIRAFVRVRDADHAVALYRAEWEHWLATDTLADGRSPYHAFDRIRGKDLVCWCPLSSPCHADILLDLANRNPDHPRSPSP